MNNAVFGKTMENLRKCRDIKLVTTKRRRNNLVSKPNHHIIKFFTEYLLAIETKKTQMLMNKLVYLRLSILELSNILMHKFWSNYVKVKNSGKVKLHYIDADCIHNTHDIYKVIVENVETRFDTSNYEVHKTLLNEKYKKVFGLMKDKLGEKIMTKFIELRTKTHF